MNGSRRTGMTVLELLVAMGVFAVIMTAAFPLVDQMMGRFQMARDHYVAASICQGRVEHARTALYAALNLLEEADMRVDDYGNVSEPNGRFRRTTTVTVDAPVAGMTTLAVKVDICICSRWGWRKHMHPLRTGSWVCRFTEEHEEMSAYFTEYKK